MARLHVREGSIAELRCPQPDCRAEIGPNALEAVLDDEAYERWHRLKIQQVMASELKGLVFCPRCEEMGHDTPVIAPAPTEEGEAPHAECPRCSYIFCGLCLGVAHATVAECVPEVDRVYRAAMRKQEGQSKALSAAERRRQERLMRGLVLEILPGTPALKVDASGCVSEEMGSAKVGDEVQTVSAGSKESKQKLLWSRKEHAFELLEESLSKPPPLVVRYRRAGADKHIERMRKRRAMEELLSLRLIASDSRLCPRCSVRINRSQGCNHMTCTQCKTHFCYRCGTSLDPKNPYGHFREGACPTFDRQEVQRIVREQHQGGMDRELEELRREFGRQQEDLDRFQAGLGQGPRRRGGPVIGDRRRQANDTACPTCGHWNARGNNNHVRCPACRTSYCHHCRRPIIGVVTRHYRGEGSCPQHGGA